MAGAVSLVPNGLAVGRARLSGPGGSRVLLEQALGEVELDRLGLGPEEVLYVPRLTGPARLRPGETRHFANGLGLVLGEIAERADRDPTGGSATDRPCRFSSRTAFAAWLIGAVLEKGRSEAAVLVRAATGRSSPQDWWRREVLSEGRSLVPLLIRLAEAGKAVRWLGTLDPIEVEQATASLTRDYGLALLPIALEAAPARLLDHESSSVATGVRADVIRRERAAADEVRAASDAIAARGEPLDELPLPARTVLVAAAVLARAPAIWRDALARAIAQGVGESRPLPSDAPAAADDAGENPVGSVSRRPAEDLFAQAGSPDRPQRRPAIMLVEPAHPDTPTIADDRAPDRSVDTSPVQALSSPALPLVSETPWNPFADSPREQVPAPLSEPREAFDTGFGGLVFLINAFLAMGLYPDFTRPLDPALPLPPLALADRLGCHWFGARYRRDPLHRWIMRRGAAGALPRRWRVEPDWLIPFGGGRAWHDGSTLWHTAGFPLANRVAATPARRLARALSVPLGSSVSGRAGRRADQDPAWLACLALFLAARFRRAAAEDALTPATLAIPARVVIGEARLDVRFALGALPLALRLAGLDRDPGWLPAEGRDVRFHFE